jgi:hypothetical protein
MDTLKLLWILPLLFFCTTNIICWLIGKTFSYLSDWTAIASNYCEIKVAGKIITTDEELAKKLKDAFGVKK